MIVDPLPWELRLELVDEVVSARLAELRELEEKNAVRRAEHDRCVRNEPSQTTERRGELRS